MSSRVSPARFIGIKLFILILINMVTVLISVLFRSVFGTLSIAGLNEESNLFYTEICIAAFSALIFLLGVFLIMRKIHLSKGGFQEMGVFVVKETAVYALYLLPVHLLMIICGTEIAASAWMRYTFQPHTALAMYLGGISGTVLNYILMCALYALTGAIAWILGQKAAHTNTDADDHPSMHDA